MSPLYNVMDSNRFDKLQRLKDFKVELSPSAQPILVCFCFDGAKLLPCIGRGQKLLTTLGFEPKPFRTST